MGQRESSGESDQPVTLPEHVRASLKKYDKHTRMTCLECGYTGLMGVKKSKRPWYLSWWSVIAFFILTIPFGGVGGLTIMAIGVLMAFAEKHQVECPNCRAELQEKKYVT